MVLLWMVRAVCTHEMILLGEKVLGSERTFMEWRKQWESQHVPGDSGRPLKSMVITGPSSSFLPGRKGTFCCVNQHCCFNHGTVLMALRSVCCTCPVLFMLCFLDTVFMCFPVDKFNMVLVVPENFKLWSFLGFVYLLNIYWNGSWPGMREEEEMLFNNTGLTHHHKWCKALFTLSVL